MHVSFRNILAGAAAVTMTTAIVAVANAQAGHVVNAPTINVGTPGSGAAGDGSACCARTSTNHVINVPGAGVPSPHIVTGGVNTTIGTHTTSIAGSTTIQNYGSGSGMLMFNDSALPVGEVYGSSVLDELNVAGAEEDITKTVMKKVPTTEEVCLPAAAGSTGPRPVQALCFDDKGAPHPASQTFEGESVEASKTGEIFRCMAGTKMQVTFGGYDGQGQITFNQGKTMSCDKGQALVHKNGELTCAREEPRRNCNERSLLRRYGPGIKIIQAAHSACVPTTRTVMKTVSEEVKVKKPSAAGGLVLDGGVGQGVY